jgi:hypothetical protein
VKVTAYLVSGIYSIVLIVLNLRIPNMVNRALGFVPLLLMLGFALFDGWLWKKWPVRLVVRGRPRLGGTWQGTLTSQERKSDGTLVIREAIPVFFVIRETFTDLSVTLITKESKSRSAVASVQRNDSSDFAVHYQYQNNPSQTLRDRSPIHRGGSVIEVSSLDPKNFSGEYWTDRWTKGEFEATWISKAYPGSFAEANQVIGQAI